jgi:hypothetical protein
MCTLTLPVLPKEPAGFFLFPGMCSFIRGNFVGNFFTVCRIHMDRKDRVIDFTAAVIIQVTELALDSNEVAKTHAAFPAPVTFEHSHIR